MNIRHLVVWKVLTTYDLWPLWGPSIVDVDVRGESLIKGHKGKVKTFFRIWVPFEITAVVENYSWSWNVGPIRATEHLVQEEDDGSSNVKFLIPIWAFPYYIICWLALRRIEKLGLCMVNP